MPLVQAAICPDAAGNSRSAEWADAQLQPQPPFPLTGVVNVEISWRCCGAVRTRHPLGWHASHSMIIWATHFYHVFTICDLPHPCYILLLHSTVTLESLHIESNEAELSRLHSPAHYVSSGCLSISWSIQTITRWLTHPWICALWRRIYWGATTSHRLGSARTCG